MYIYLNTGQDSRARLNKFNALRFYEPLTWSCAGRP